ncbi:MAG: glycosyltransferase family 4 protein [candidate division NC10 bacterium]|nr:glycosyltransferase family 4 protein [candidate division NC10 bacterium]
MAEAHQILYVYRSSGQTYGGALVDLLNILSHLDRTRFNAMVLLSRGTEHLPIFHRLAVETTCLPLPAIRKGKSIPFLPWAVLRLLRLLRARKISLVHVNDADDAAIVALACRLARIPCVVHARSEMVPRKFRKLRLQWANLLIAVSEGVRRKAIQGGLCREQVVTVYSGIDVARAKAVGNGQKIRREYGIAPETLVIGCVANISPKKGYDVLIRAVAKARREIPDLACLILGADDRGLRSGLERLGESLDLGGRLRFAGFQEDVFPYLDAMDLFVLASVDEGFGIVLLEAMASGKPVVATTVDGPPEVVEDARTGLLVPPGDTDALAKALVELLKDPQRRALMGELGRGRVETVFGLETQMRILTGLYDRLLNRSSG